MNNNHNYFYKVSYISSEIKSHIQMFERLPYGSFSFYSYNIKAHRATLVFRI